MTSQATKGSLLVIFLTVFIDLLGFGMVLPLLPVYADHFNVGNSGWILGALMASFSAMQFICAPFWGRLSDRIGHLVPAEAFNTWSFHPRKRTCCRRTSQWVTSSCRTTRCLPPHQ